MRAGRERAGELLGREHRADREAAAEPLRERDGVGPAPDAVAPEEPSEPPDARLHLVDEEQRAVLVGDRAKRREEPGGAGRTPPSPCTGSTMMARRRGPSRASTASTSPYGTCVTGPSGPKPSRYFGVPVIESAPSVRPWKTRCRTR